MAEPDSAQPERPGYLRVAAALRGRIASGQVKPGAVLPSAAALGEAFDVSRAIARRALDQLRDEGVIRVRPGGRCWVTAEPPPQP